MQETRTDSPMGDLRMMGENPYAACGCVRMISSRPSALSALQCPSATLGPPSSLLPGLHLPTRLPDPPPPSTHSPRLFQLPLSTPHPPFSTLNNELLSPLLSSASQLHPGRALFPQLQCLCSQESCRTQAGPSPKGNPATRMFPLLHLDLEGP